MKERLRASAVRQMGKTAIREHASRQGSRLSPSQLSLLIFHAISPAKYLKEAPPLPQDPSVPEKSPMAEMEDWLDKLLV